MFRTLSCALFVATAVTVASAADHHGRNLAVVMTNDPAANQVEVYDAQTGVLLQRVPTRGRGGASGNARGVRQLDGDLVAAVNFGSSSVTLFRRVADRLQYDGQVQTTSPPVSVDFGNGHMYVAGVSTVDSFVMHGHEVGRLDGTALLELAGGGTPAEGSTAQVGVFDDRHLLVTLKAPDPGTVDVIPLRGGAVSDAPPLAVAAPDGSLTPFGFLVDGDGSALVTLAGSNQNGLFRGDRFVDVTAAGQGAPCWMTRAGEYVFVSNTGGLTIGRIVGTGSHVFTDAAVAAPVPTGGPGDLDAADGLLAVVDHGGGRAHLSLFAYNGFGELGRPRTLTLSSATTNGVALLVR
jgi:hypothetical protein